MLLNTGGQRSLWGLLLAALCSSLVGGSGLAAIAPEPTMKGLFAKARRDFSHGCIRVSDPAALAAHVLRDQPEWTAERIQAAMSDEDNTPVNLSGPVPVCIIHTTAITRENGDVYFYSDIYRLDKKLDQMLAKGYPYPK